MYCRKCGKENPDDGKYCRTCGNDLNGDFAENTEPNFNLEDWIEENVGPVFEGKHVIYPGKKKDSWESAMGRLFMGAALLAISGVLAFQPVGQNWWFWLMIPAFLLMGSGVAKIIKIEKSSDQDADHSVAQQRSQIKSRNREALPPKQTKFASDVVESPRDTAKVAPPSIVENTTRHLELDPDGETTKLPQD